MLGAWRGPGEPAFQLEAEGAQRTVQGGDGGGGSRLIR